MNTDAQAGGSPDLLSSIMGVTVKNEEKIAAEDREFCEDRQEKLYRTLHQLNWWYGLFTANAERYRESHNLTYTGNGSVNTRNLRRFHHNESSEDYSAFEFLPFDGIDDVVKLYGKAVEAFARDVVRHFNRKYGISVSSPYIDDEKLPMGSMPTYQTYVDMVIGHLGGKDFRETAEEELLTRFRNVLAIGCDGIPLAALKGDTIIFADVLRYQDNSRQTTLRLSFSYPYYLNALCAGVIFSVTGSLSGSADYIAHYNCNAVDVSCWYGLTVSTAITVKFYKNGRVDFKFADADAAERCWKKLRLDTFKTTDDDE